MTDDLEKMRRRRERGSPVRPAGAYDLSTDQVLIRVDAAAEQHDPAAYYAGKTPTPERITIALDMRELYGPEVDQALGGEEPMVDDWESGERVPTFGQMQRLSVLTGFPVRFFYQPASRPITGGWICGSGGCRPLGETEEHECPTCGKPR